MPIIPSNAAAHVDQHLIAAFLAAMAREFPGSRVLLIGSRARGDRRVDSDDDFVVLSAAFDGVSPVWRGHALYGAWGRLLPPVDADLVGLTPEQDERARYRPTSSIGAADQEASPIEGGRLERHLPRDVRARLHVHREAHVLFVLFRMPQRHVHDHYEVLANANLDARSPVDLPLPMGQLLALELAGAEAPAQGGVSPTHGLTRLLGEVIPTGGRGP